MKLTQERLKELLHYDTIFTWKVKASRNTQVGSAAGTTTPRGYVTIQIDGHRYYAHRLAWLYVHGVWPQGQIDHKDEDKSNNRISNLREATDAQNNSNKSNPHRDNATGFQGVSYDEPSRKYLAQIQVSGKKRNLGRFSSPEEASEVYLAAKAVHHPFWVAK